MNRAAFFAALRSGPLFGNRLLQQQVEGTEALIDAAERHGVSNIHHVANILAQVYRETGAYMLPIKETVYASHKDKNPSDATVIARLDAAFAKGQLSWVKTPYWRDGWFGRGPIQLTHKANYERMGRRMGVDLVGNRDLALEKSIGADIAVIGMSEGLFTGKKLGDYNFPAALDASPSSNPRRIVNGVDGTDVEVAGYHRAFVSALQAAGFGSQPEIIVRPIPPIEETPMPHFPPIGHNGGPPLEPGYEHPPRPSPVEQSAKAVGAGKWAAIAGALWTAVVAADVLPAAFTTPEFIAAVTAFIGATAGAIGAYRAPKNAEPG